MIKYLFAGMILLISAVIIFQTASNVESSSSTSTVKRILLLGASVGYAWDLPDWPQRTMTGSRFVTEMVPEYQFDKREALKEILMRPARKFRLNRAYIMGFFKPAPVKPDIIIIKECAAYFPGDMAKYKTIILQMISMCREAHVTLVLATAVPVTQQHSSEKPGRAEAILAYNDWIREYSKQNGLKCLDIESVLRVSEKIRYLKENYTSGDGLHLNSDAYKALDTYLRNNIEAFVR